MIFTSCRNSDKNSYMKQKYGLFKSKNAELDLVIHLMSEQYTVYKPIFNDWMQTKNKFKQIQSGNNCNSGDLNDLKSYLFTIYSDEYIKQNITRSIELCLNLTSKFNINFELETLRNELGVHTIDELMGSPYRFTNLKSFIYKQTKGDSIIFTIGLTPIDTVVRPRLILLNKAGTQLYFNNKPIRYSIHKDNYKGGLDGIILVHLKSGFNDTLKLEYKNKN